MNQELINKYKPIFQNEVVKGQVTFMGMSNGIEEECVPDMVDILEEMGYSDFLINNSHNLVLDESSFEDLVETSIKLHKIRSELFQRIGENNMGELEKVLAAKTGMWWENHGDEFSEKMQALYQKRIDNLKSGV